MIRKKFHVIYIMSHRGSFLGVKMHLSYKGISKEQRLRENSIAMIYFVVFAIGIRPNWYILELWVLFN